MRVDITTESDDIHAAQLQAALGAAYAFLLEIAARNAQSNLLTPPAAEIAPEADANSEEEWSEAA